MCVCVNDLMTGQLWARQDTKESSHKLFQALRRFYINILWKTTQTGTSLALF